MNTVTNDMVSRKTPPDTLAGACMGLAVIAFLGSALADAAWGWEGTAGAVYGVGSLLLVAAGFLLVATQVQLHKIHGGLGRAAQVGIAVSALGALLSFVSWAVVLWGTVLGVGTLLFGTAVLRQGRVPRPLALTLTWAAPAVAAAAWAGAILSGGEDSAVSTVADVGVGVALLVLAWGLIGVGRWSASVEPA
ncbi:MAG: hypothetical protein QOH36_459 [Actinomycetota bacterium]|nr:hypothetical protein [Actinomycetota bacterium]